MPQTAPNFKTQPFYKQFPERKCETINNQILDFISQNWKESFYITDGGKVKLAIFSYRMMWKHQSTDKNNYWKTYWQPLAHATVDILYENLTKSLMKSLFGQATLSCDFTWNWNTREPMSNFLEEFTKHGRLDARYKTAQQKFKKWKAKDILMVQQAASKKRKDQQDAKDREATEHEREMIRKSQQHQYVVTLPEDAINQMVWNKQSREILARFGGMRDDDIKRLMEEHPSGWTMIEFLSNPSEELQAIAIKHSKVAIRRIKNPSAKIKKLHALMWKA